MSSDRHHSAGSDLPRAKPRRQAWGEPVDGAGFAPAAALALFVPGPAGGRTLVIGEDSEPIARSIAFLGGTAECWDPFVTRSPSGMLDVDRTGSTAWDATLPFNSELFDSIVLNRALDAPGGAPAGQGRRFQRALLNECRRVLKPGATLVAAVENRFSAERVRQRWPDPVTSGLYLGMLPHTLADVYARARHSQRYGFRSYSVLGWRSLLHQAGFRLDDLRRLWPAEDASKEIQFGESLNQPIEWLKPLARPGSPRAALSRFLRQPGIKRWIASAFLLIASRPSESGGASTPPPLLAAVEREEEFDEKLSSLSLRVRQTSQTVSFVSGSSFVKLPLTADARDRVCHEAEAHRRFADRPASRLMLHPVQRKEITGFSYVTFPAVTPLLAPRSAGELHRHYDLLLAALGEDARAMRLQDTMFWELVFTPGIVDELRGLGAGPVLQRVEASAHRRVPAGVVHGDMARNNLMVTTEGMRVIDWDRWEDPSPHFVDVVAACFSVGRAENLWGQEDQVTQVELIAAGDPRVPFRERLEWARGELSLAEAVAFRMLSRATRQRMYHPENRGFDDGLRAYFHTCERVLQKDVPPNQTAGTDGTA